jgi:Uri superfamily endonuclease
VQELARPGTYALLFACPKRARASVGALGGVELSPGHLVYVGSALGSGGLAGRLRHHVAPLARPRWHVDFLRAHASLIGAWWTSNTRRLEHAWAACLASAPSFAELRTGFGASDCRCTTHLFHRGRRPGDRWMRERLGRTCGGGPIRFTGAQRLAGEILPR